MLAAALAKLLWLAVHWLFDLWIRAYNYWECRRRPLKKPDLIPRHVAFVACDQPHAPDFLARLVIWSLSAGVSHFTFYDSTGMLKENEEKLYTIVEKLKGNTPGQIKWGNRPDINGYKNGINRSIAVHIFSRNDGKKKLVSLVRSMCDSDRSRSDANDMNVDDFDSLVNEEYRYVPEPELVFFCGELYCTRGFLPWHIRLTEFLSLGSHNINLERFYELLNTYSKCEQRFGK